MDNRIFFNPGDSIANIHDYNEASKQKEQPQTGCSFCLVLSNWQQCSTPVGATTKSKISVALPLKFHRRQEFLDPRRWVVKEVIGRPGEVNPAVFDKDDLVGHPAGKFHVVSHHN